jgi:hypothetical protein
MLLADVILESYPGFMIICNFNQIDPSVVMILSCYCKYPGGDYGCLFCLDLSDRVFNSSCSVFGII